MQTALGVVKATFQALTRDTAPQGAGAEIHLHTTAQAVVKGYPSGPPQSAQAPGEKPGDGTPVPPGQYIALNQK